MSVLYSQVVSANYNPIFGLANVSTINANTVNVSTINSLNIYNSNLVTTNEINAAGGSISTISSAYVYSSDVLCSTISAGTVVLDGNTLTTGGTSTLYFNGIPLVTVLNLSSIGDWALEPAIANVDMANHNLLNASGVFTTNLTASATGSVKILNTSNIVASNDIMTTTLEATGLMTASGGLSTTFIKANLGNFSTFNSLTTTVSTINAIVGIISSLNANTVTASTGTFSSITGSFPPILNYSTLAVSTLSTVNITGSNAAFYNLSNTNSAVFANGATFNGTRPNFNTGINTSGPNNFNNQNVDNLSNVNGTVIAVNANVSLGLQSQFHTDVVADRGTDVSDHSVVNIDARYGSGGIVNITGSAASVLGIVPASQVNVTAAGNTAYSANSPIGGKVTIAANAGGASILFPVGTILAGNGEVDITAYSYIGGTGITPGVVKISGGTCSMYAGPVSAVSGVYGYNYVYGTLGNNITAGIPSGGIPTYAGTNYLYGYNGTSINNGLFTDELRNYGSSNLNISAKTGNWVNISSCQAMYMGNNPLIDGGGGTTSRIKNFFQMSADQGFFTGVYGVSTIDNSIGVQPAPGAYDLKLTTYYNPFANIYHPITLTSCSNINLNTQNGGKVYVNADLIGTSTIQAQVLSTLNLNISSLNGSAYPTPGAWVSTATSRLDMASYPIAVSSLTGVSTINGVSFPFATPIVSSFTNLYATNASTTNLLVSSINNQSYPPASGGSWVSTATNYLNMNGNPITDFTGSLSLLVSSGSTYTSLTETPTTIDLLQAGGAGYIRRNAAGNIIDTAVGNIQTQAVSTINTVTQTIFSGGLARTLVGSNIIQPIIQTGYVSSSGTSGTITVNLPTRYTTQQSYMTFGNMIDSPAAQIFTSSITRGSFILGWTSGGAGNQTFNWMTLGA